MTKIPAGAIKRLRLAAVMFAATFPLMVALGAASAGEFSTHAVAAMDGENARVEADLLFDATSVVAGGSLRVGVRMRMDPDWHIYWKNSGDSGFPTEVDWTSSDGSFGPLQYPAPEVFIDSGGLGTTYGYSGEVLLVSHARIDENASGLVGISAKVSFLVCKIQCIPGQIQLESTLPVEAVPKPEEPDVVAGFEQSASRLPLPLEESGIDVSAEFSVASIRSGENFEVTLSVATCTAPLRDCATTVVFAPAPGEFAIDAPESLDLDRAGTLDRVAEGTGGQLVLRGRVLKGQHPPDHFGGVLALVVDGRPRGVEIVIDLPLGESVQGSASATVDLSPPIGGSETPDFTVWAALGFGLLGGLILNLMPCVLPVLALKAYRIIEAGGSDPRELRAEGLAFTFGVLLSMAGLAGIILVLRSAGEVVGWGFQFQEPGFLAFMGALLTIFALNLFGVFEIIFAPNSLAGVGRESSAILRSFFDGTLAVLLATPCSAPFLGTAVGFAFSGSSATVVVVFLAIGLGLALPYLAISFVPGLASKLPRPGAWMENVRTLLGFSLLVTVVWLLWIAGRSVGASGVVWLVGLLLAIGIVAWGFGKTQTKYAERPGLFFAIFTMILVMLVVYGIRSLPIENESSRAQIGESVVAIWDAREVRRVVESGQAVFVDFTADWCVSCKVNERFVLSRPEVEDAMRHLDVARFRADWTLRDEAIFAELQRHGRAGVPLYLVYRAGAPDDPEILPEILTIDRVVAALRRASEVGQGVGLDGRIQALARAN